MASLATISEVVFNSTVLAGTANTTVGATTILPTKATLVLGPRTPTLPPGHAAILEMHANSRSNAIIYISVVLLLYVIGMAVVLVKYIRTERYEARLTRLFQDLVQREHFFRVSRRRRSSVPKNSQDATTCLREDMPNSSSFVIQENSCIDIESKL